MHLKWRFERKALASWGLATLTLILFTNCDAGFGTRQVLNSTTSASSTSGLEGCSESLNASPSTIDEVVTLINNLPKPLSIACFLSHLQKPLQVYAVDNAFSAQPSQGPDNPRIFLLSHGQLLISAVPLGSGREVLEFSQITSAKASIKGEIAFPVLDQIESSAPYSRIIESIGKTTCSVCHQPETAAPAITTGEAYNSGLIQPDPLRRISAGHLQSVARLCETQKDPERCAILKTIFLTGGARDVDFPFAPPGN